MYKKMLGLNDSGDRVYVTFDEGAFKGDEAYVMTWSVSPDGVVTILENKPWTDVDALMAERQAAATAEGTRSVWLNFGKNMASSINLAYGSIKSSSMDKLLPKSSKKSKDPYLWFFDEYKDSVKKINTKTTDKRYSVPDRHHKRKPQPNRGPIGRKEYQ